MKRKLYILSSILMLLLLNGCSQQSSTLRPKVQKNVAPYSLESLELRYQTKGY